MNVGTRHSAFGIRPSLVATDPEKTRLWLVMATNPATGMFAGGTFKTLDEAWRHRNAMRMLCYVRVSVLGVWQ